jgi:hypothetical protein
MRTPSSARRFLLALVLSAATSSAAMADLLYVPVVVRVGVDAPIVSGTGYTTQIYVYQHSVANQLAPVASAAYNSGSSGTRLVTSASANSQGGLSNNPGLAIAAASGTLYSGTGYVYNAGYNTATGTTSVNSTATNAQRSVGQTTVNAFAATNATVLQTQTQATAYSDDNIRSATAASNAANPTLYTAGQSGTASTAGWRDFSTNTQLAPTPTNTRSVEQLQGGLFGSAASGTRGLYVISGGTATNIINTGATSSPYEFALFNDASNANLSAQGYNLAYIADDQTSTSGGIRRYSYNGTSWVFDYQLQSTSTTGYRGLAGQYDADNDEYTLFATTADGLQLQQITDGGSTLGSSYMTLATTDVNDPFRGVALAAIPEPQTIVLTSLSCVLGLCFGMRRWLARRRQEEESAVSVVA